MIVKRDSHEFIYLGISRLCQTSKGDIFHGAHLSACRSRKLSRFSIICRAVDREHITASEIIHDARVIDDLIKKFLLVSAIAHIGAVCVFNRRSRICHQISTFPLYEYRLVRNNKSSRRRFCSSSFFKKIQAEDAGWCSKLSTSRLRQQ